MSGICDACDMGLDVPARLHGLDCPKRGRKRSKALLLNVDKQAAIVRVRAAEMEIKVARRELRKAWKALAGDTAHLALAMDAVDRALEALRDTKEL